MSFTAVSRGVVRVAYTDDLRAAAEELGLRLDLAARRYLTDDGHRPCDGTLTMVDPPCDRQVGLIRRERAGEAYYDVVFDPYRLESRPGGREFLERCGADLGRLLQAYNRRAVPRSLQAAFGDIAYLESPVREDGAIDFTVEFEVDAAESDHVVLA